MRPLNGKVALITGSSSGIGHGMARTMASRGASVVLHGIETEDQLRSMGEDLAREFDTPVVAVSADLRQPEAVRHLVQSTVDRLGSLDILVNNAGIQFVSPVESFPLEQWRAVIDIHLTAAFLLTQEAVPLMRQRGWGRIVNVASVHGLVASVHKAAYVAAKHGLIGLTKVTALETAGQGLTCNAICPGWVRTPLVEQQIAKKAQEQELTLEEAASRLVGEKQPTKQFVSVDQIGELLAFLCSDAASAMTGVSLPIDGAWTAQ